MPSRILSGKEFKIVFRAETRKLAKRLQRGVMIGLTDHVFNGVTVLTPVDTGRARNNWWPTLGTPSGARTTLVSDATVTGAPLSGSEKQRLANIKALIASSPIQTVWISNNLDYIEDLENGTGSRKAPAGMVQVTLSSLEGVKIRGLSNDHLG